MSACWSTSRAATWRKSPTSSSTRLGTSSAIIVHRARLEAEMRRNYCVHLVNGHPPPSLPRNCGRHTWRQRRQHPHQPGPAPTMTRPHQHHHDHRQGHHGVASVLPTEAFVASKDATSSRNTSKRRAASPATPASAPPTLAFDVDETSLPIGFDHPPTQSSPWPPTHTRSVVSIPLWLAPGDHHEE